MPPCAVGAVVDSGRSEDEDGKGEVGRVRASGESGRGRRKVWRAAAVSARVNDAAATMVVYLSVTMRGDDVDKVME